MCSVLSLSLSLYIYIYIYIYIERERERSAIKCTKFGEAVLKASMLNWGMSICCGYMCIVLYMKLISCNGFAEIFARSAMSCAKCGVAVLKASMLNWGMSICCGYMCIVLYMKLIWCNCDTHEIQGKSRELLGIS